MCNVFYFYDNPVNSSWQFLGTWYDVAKASRSPYMQRYSGEQAIGKLVLQKGSTDEKLKMTRTVLRLDYKYCHISDIKEKTPKISISKCSSLVHFSMSSMNWKFVFKVTWSQKKHTCKLTDCKTFEFHLLDDQGQNQCSPRLSKVQTGPQSSIIDV